MTIGLRTFLVFLFDLAAAAIAWSGSFWLRFNFSWWPEYTTTVLLGLACLLPVHTLFCRWAGLYRGLWIFASLPDLKRMLKAIVGSALVMGLFAVIYRPSPAVPRSLIVLYPALLVLIMGGGRVAYRMWKEHRLFGGLIAQGKPVLIIGAGSAAATLARELERGADWRVVGLLDDDESKWGRELGGHRVLGALSSLPVAAESFKVRHAILAMPSASLEVRRKIVELAAQAEVSLLTAPGLQDVMPGNVTTLTMRRVEIDDLLGREVVKIETQAVLATLSDKVILVTGAGGSIGSELCRQLARFAPRKLLLFEQSEYALYMIEQWFAHHHPEIEIASLAGDVKDRVRLDEVFGRHRPQVVFHAAAYKHVPLMEVGNAWQAVRNNVLGTLLTARCAHANGVERFVLISTDKAVNPTNVMGATKRLAEMVCQAVQAKSSTRFQTVRFGNVLGSAGSVIPKFQEQIGRGGPVTVTHPEITRYFMSIPEAALLVLQAAVMGEGGDIIVLDMGEPVRIVDLARNMIRLCGYAENDIRIEFTGLRPGEKLYEELLANSEQTRSTSHEKLRIARFVPVSADLDELVFNWISSSQSVSDDAVRHALQAWVSEYAPANVPILASSAAPVSHISTSRWRGTTSIKPEN